MVFKETQPWYLEYKIHKNRPGLLGDISSMLGLMNVNIMTINGVDLGKRGMILHTNDMEKIELIGKVLRDVTDITITAFRPPTMLDRLAVRHGKYIDRDLCDKKTFRFTREEIGLLVDFVSEIFRKPGHQLIGIRGMPRVGKTESIVAGSVSANKKWILASSTLLRQTVRSQLIEDEMDPNNVFIIDGIVSTLRATENHRDLIQEILRMPSIKVIEHPDIFIRETEYDLDDFDYIIELRNDPNEEISYDLINTGFSSFDIS